VVGGAQDLGCSGLLRGADLEATSGKHGVTMATLSEIALVLRSIVGNVNKAAARANWPGQILQFPYPGRWHRNREAFIAALVPVIRRLRLEDESALSQPRLG
jgi:hypothetical protein